jgi:hypothetical protein
MLIESETWKNRRHQCAGLDAKEIKAYIVQKFGSGIPLNVVTVEVTPAQLNINPELIAGRAIHLVLIL